MMNKTSSFRYLIDDRSRWIVIRHDIIIVRSVAYQFISVLKNNAKYTYRKKNIRTKATSGQFVVSQIARIS